MSDHLFNKGVSAAIVALGCTSIVTQTILLREFLAVFAGNELVIGIVLANWMILTGVGALLGRLSDKIRGKPRASIVLLVLGAVLPLLTVFLLRFLRNLVFPVGTLIGVIESAYSSFILLLPYCMTGGFLFSLLAQVVSERRRSNWISNVYSLESAGGVAGGLVFNLVAVFFLSTFQSLLLLALFNLIVCMVLSARYGHRFLMYTVIGSSAVLLIVAGSVDLDNITSQRMFEGQSVLYHRDTPYGNLTVTRQGEQTNFFENSTLLFSTNDVVASEEAVHYAMVQHPRPRKVLMVSGGLSGIAPEVFKYGVAQIDYLEINPWIVEVGKNLTSAFEDKRIHVIADDARRYLRRAQERYDVVLLNVPDPGTAQINRYYTEEFFGMLKSCLHENGVVSLSLLASADYYGSDARLVGSSIFKTLRSLFKNVLVVPGNRNAFIASDGDLSINITRLIQNRGISTTYVNGHYINDDLLQERSDATMRSLHVSIPPNRDFTPIAYYRQLRYWLSYFSFNPWMPAIVAAIILLAVVLKLNAVSFGLLAGGFAASSIEIVILISFQIIYGYVYQATGVIITLFMAGLATGSWYGSKMNSRITMGLYAAVQGFVAAYCMLLPAVLVSLKDQSLDSVVYGVFALLTMGIAMLIGVEFSMATKLLRGSISTVASELYSVDLIGSAIGALIISVYLVPLMGITFACLVVGLVSLLSASVSILRRSKYVFRAEEGVSYV